MGTLMSGETPRLLLVSDSAATREEISNSLVARFGDHSLFWVSQPELAPGRAQDVLPHAILIDDHLGGASPVTLIGQLAVRLPSTPVLALVDADAIALARKVVLAGARGFATKPIQPDELLSALRQILALRAGPAGDEASDGQTGRVVVFCAPKGGTGRTTLAINTGIALLNQTGVQVALVDADFSSPALDVALNLDNSRNILDLLPQIGRLDSDLVSSVLADHASGVRVLLASPPADLTHPISLPQVQQVLVWLKRMFPWVIVDLGLPLDETAFAFLDSADRIVMSVLPEMVGLRNTRLMLDQLRARGYPDERIWLVLNRADVGGGVPAADIEARLRVRTRYAIPDDPPLATRSVNRGVPLVVSYPRSALAKAFRGFAAQLADDLHPAQAEARNLGRSGLFRRLLAQPAIAHSPSA